MVAAKKKATARAAPRAKKKAVAKKKATAKKPSSRMAWRAERAKENAARKAAAEKPPKVIWQPLPGSQSLAVTCPCNHILLAGARGGGKTDAQLMMFRKNVGVGYGQHWRGIIFDREYKQLSDLIAKSKRWFRGLGDGAKFLSGNSQLKWVWPTGEELLFRTVKTEEDYENYHGHEYAYIGHNELTKHPNLDMYDMLMSINRSSFVPELHSPDKDNPLPEIPLVVVSTTNPYGPGHNAVKTRFIDAAPPGVVVPMRETVFNPRTQQKEIVTKTQVHIFSSYKENRNLAPEYVLELERIKDPNKRRAWLYGDWDITSGGLLDDVWNSEYNVVKPFDIPQGWNISRSFDWGSSRPFSVCWFAESDGNDVMVGNGKWRSTIKGDVYLIQEWYGWTGKDNTGLRMLNTQIAAGIIERELKWGWYGRVQPGPADNSINDLVNGSSVAIDMGKPVKVNGKIYNGPLWTQSIKAPGSRVQGAEKMRVAIYNAQPDEITGQRESAGLFVFDHCKDGFLRTVPGIPRDPKNLDDAAGDSENHCYDSVRYYLLSTGSRFGSGKTMGTAN